MQDGGNGKGPEFPTYKSAPTKDNKAVIEFKRPKGHILSQVNGIQVEAPLHTDFPVESGDHLQVVNKNITNEALGETPLLSEKADPKAILRTIAVAIGAEEALVERTEENVWANLNVHSRPPTTGAEPFPAQYNPIVVDIHGRSIDPKNWTRPPATHGEWGLRPEAMTPEQERAAMEEVDEFSTDSGKVIPGTADEIEKHRKDPLGHAPLDPRNPNDFAGWEQNPTGTYDWDGPREYSPKRLQKLQSVFSQDVREKMAVLQDIELFPTARPEKYDFEPNATDIELWSFGGFQLVTQKNPLTPPDKGIHMVLKLRPEPHTPWSDPKQTLEAYAIGIGVARLLKNTKGMGEIGDVYLDMNANWSMTNKEELRKQVENGELLADDFKKMIQVNTRAHLHIQLEKMTKKWELPPAPGTFTSHSEQPLAVEDEIWEILNKPHGGLTEWIFQHCSETVKGN